MKTFDWKDKYLDYSGVDVTGTSNYISILGTSSGIGTRENPYNVSKQVTATTAIVSMILSNGAFLLNIVPTSINGISPVVGTSMTGTILNVMTTISAYGNLRNLTIQQLVRTGTAVAGIQVSMKDCILDNFAAYSSGNEIPLVFTVTSIINCIQKGKIHVRNTNTNFLFARQNTFVDIVTGPESYYAILTGNSLFNKCTINIDAASLATNPISKYNAFNNCLFRIGSETTGTALSGTTEDQLRASFVARCEAQGFTVPIINDYGTDVKAGRWVFSNTSVTGDYSTITNSEIDQFAQLRGIYFGHTSNTVTKIPITTTLNIPASFNSQSPGDNITLQDDSISLSGISDITQRAEAYIDSKIIWLGGLKKLSDLNIAHNLPTIAGIAPDSVFAFADVATESGSIEAGNFYIVRSKDANISSIKYNNVVYSSSLITRTNVFLGIANVGTFTIDSGNPKVIQVLDKANYQSAQIRLMREIPTPQITTGNLQAGYWYFVEPNNLSDTSGTVTYKGVVRPAFDSFLVDAANLTFTVNGTCHLRRCWKQDFDFETEPTDKAFWTDRQKPNYFDVIPDDLRCLLKNHTSTSVEMETGDDGDYIASGHVEFYNGINGTSGFRFPAFDIVGSFLQIRIPITTINPM